MRGRSSTASGSGFSPTVQYESYDLDLLLLVVHQGAAASILPRLVLPPQRETAVLTRLETGWARTLVSLARAGQRAGSLGDGRSGAHSAADSGIGSQSD